MGLATVVVAYGCCVGSWEKYNRYVEPRIPDHAYNMALDEQTSIAEAYNAILDEYRGFGLDMLILQHDDLEIVDPNAEEKFLDALSLSDVALVGVAGGHGVGSLAWWNANTVGHQLIDSGMLDFGPRTGYVDLLEGSILVFGPWAIEHLRFDIRFNGFHGYDDIAMIAHSYGKRVYVADVDTHHHVQLGFKSEASAQAWAVADAQFREKWGL